MMRCYEESYLRISFVCRRLGKPNIRGCKTDQLFRKRYFLKLDIMYGSASEADEECRGEVKMTFHSERLKD